MLTLNTELDPISPVEWKIRSTATIIDSRSLWYGKTFRISRRDSVCNGTTYPEKLSVGLHRPQNPSLGSSKALLEAF